uniref:Uncharacterized protein n=1 Tax=Amphimedon queenslandica TaxID=400682 RepID=A0A1X7VC15_AMPQE
MYGFIVACLGQPSLAAPTGKAYLSGILQLQIARGIYDPGIGNMPRGIWTQGEPKVYRDKEMLWAKAGMTFFTFSCTVKMTVPEGNVVNY